MDDVLYYTEEYIFNPYLYPDESSPYYMDILQRDHAFRQCLSLFMATTLGGYLLYFSFSTLDYYLLFDKEYEKHPKFLKNQKYQEIMVSVKSVPVMVFLTLPIFLAEVRGYSLLYDRWDERGVPFLLWSMFLFLMFNDFGIYWIHRYEHHPLVYKHIHKLHHKWLVPTPYASYAFNPIDGFLQSTPYHIFIFLYPLPKYVYLGLFVTVNFWTISIHDGYFKVPEWLEWWINGAAHHSSHHLYFDYNYGQYFTFWDRIGKSFRRPEYDIVEAAKTKKASKKLD